MDDASWLTRLSAQEWLRSAENELAASERALLGKQQRAGLTQARRAAGMAWNAVLLGIEGAEREKYGRSYMDHLRVLRGEESVSATVREAAEALVTAPLDQQLVQLGQGDTTLARAAGVIVEEARRRVDGSARS